MLSAAVIALTVAAPTPSAPIAPSRPPPRRAAPVSPRHQLVERHHDVGPEQPLQRQYNRSGLSMCRGPIEMAGKGAPSSLTLLSLPTDSAPGTNPPLIGQHRPLPAHEANNDAEFDRFGAPPAMHQVIGIAKDDVRPARAHLAGPHRLDHGAPEVEALPHEEGRRGPVPRRIAWSAGARRPVRRGKSKGKSASPPNSGCSHRPTRSPWTAGWKQPPRLPSSRSTGAAHDRHDRLCPPARLDLEQPSGSKFAGINRPPARRTTRTSPSARHPLQLYSQGTPNGQKVTILLEELLERGHWAPNMTPG